MASQFGKTFDQTTGQLSQQGERIVRNVERVADRAAENIGETVDQVRLHTNDGLDRVEIAIRRNPLAATAIAAGVGFFVAALARR
jgi:ElaB/YqjD/DUF883 family membrane-anchored ribosome-binding protein